MTGYFAITPSLCKTGEVLWLKLGVVSKILELVCFFFEAVETSPELQALMHRAAQLSPELPYMKTFELWLRECVSDILCNKSVLRHRAMRLGEDEVRIIFEETRQGYEYYRDEINNDVTRERFARVLVHRPQLGSIGEMSSPDDVTLIVTRLHLLVALEELFPSDDSSLEYGEQSSFIAW